MHCLLTWWSREDDTGRYRGAQIRGHREALLTIVERRWCAGHGEVPDMAKARTWRSSGSSFELPGLRICECGVRKFAATSGEGLGDEAEPRRSALQAGFGLGGGLRGVERREVGRVDLGGVGRRAVPAAR
ncbi:hypothetical protein GCM10010317_093570 [Streptomyces mirabilis]|nr:hypothetical protein GCM10010317_093570 [Streptomyces mirabilis]